MPNRNIYFTDEHVAQMKKFPNENWSAVCQEAVGSRIRYLSLKSEADTSAVDRARVRLATAKATYIADALERGDRAGTAWAADVASFEELRRLDDGIRSEHPALIFPVDDGVLPSLCLAQVIYGGDLSQIPTIDSPEDVDLAQTLCQAAGLSPDSDDITTSKFWEGFVNGALRIYDGI